MIQEQKTLLITPVFSAGDLLMFREFVSLRKTRMELHSREAIGG